jgi:hypothetical protein
MRLGREKAALEREQGLRPLLTRNRHHRPANDQYAGPITETPEFKAAVADAVSKAVNEALPKIAQGLASSTASEGIGIDAILSKLAMQIAELNDQGSSAPKRIPPEIILARQDAHERMMALIEKERRAKARDPSHEPPMFQLVSKMTADLPEAGSVLLEPVYRGADNRVYPTELAWLGIPNLAMEPQNASARAIMEAFKESIGNKVSTTFKIRDEDPSADQGLQTSYAVTSQGHVVTGGSATLMTRNRVDTGQPAGVAMVRNEPSVLVQNPGALPYKDIRVLGSIAPPARQNG